MRRLRNVKLNAEQIQWLLEEVNFEYFYHWKMHKWDPSVIYMENPALKIQINREIIDGERVYTIWTWEDGEQGELLERNQNTS